MLRKNEEIKEIIKPNLKGGQGDVKNYDFAFPEEMYNRIKLYSKMVLEKGVSLGFHKHNGEMEIYYVLKGEAIYQDDDQTYTIKPGDVTICKSGHSHGIVNEKDETFEYIALIIVE